MARHRASYPRSTRTPATPRRSWLDRLQDAVDATGWPPVALYAALWLAHFAVATAVKWSDGALPIGTVFAWHGATAGAALACLALMHHLDRVAGEAVEAFRPMLDCDDERFADVRSGLVRLPAGATLAAGLIGASIGALPLREVFWNEAVTGPMRLATSPASMAIEIATYLAMWFALGTLAFHSVHQLHAVHRVLTVHTRANLFRLDPVYRFSWLTARTAIGVVTIPLAYLWAASSLIPMRAEWVITAVGFAAVGVVAFVWPLWSTHEVLRAEKRARLLACLTRLEVAFAALHDPERRGSGVDPAQDKAVIESLLLEQGTLERTSTWPWRPETSRLLVTAVLLPTTVFVVQHVVAVRLGW